MGENWRDEAERKAGPRARWTVDYYRYPRYKEESLKHSKERMKAS